MNRDFRLLLGAGLISLTGDWVMRVGLAYAVYALTGSTLASAGALLASLVPQFAISSFAGVFVDRWERRRVMVVTNLLLAAGLLPLLAVHDRSHVWIVYLVAAVQSGLGQFFVAAEAAVIPRLVEERHLVAANAFNGQARDVARLAGAAVGGLVAGVGGIPLLAVVDIVTFGVAAGTLLFIRTPTGHGDKTRRPHVLREWADGLRVAGAAPALRVLLLFVVLTGTGEAIMGSLMAPFVRNVLHADAAAFGLIMAVQAGGGIAGGLAAAGFGHRIPPRRLVGYGALAFGALDLVLFLYPLLDDAWWPALVIMPVVGVAGAFMLAGLFTLFQTHSDDAYRGRLFGVFNAVEAAAMLIGAFAAGVLGDRLGIVPVIAVQGAEYCLAGALVLLLLASRRTATAQIRAS